MKQLKHEIDMRPKDQRKDLLRRKREEKEIEQAEKVSPIALHLCSSTKQLVDVCIHLETCMSKIFSTFFVGAAVP